MLRWDTRSRKKVENAKADNFINDIIKVCKTHDLSLSHEDFHGAFQIDSFKSRNIEWLKRAHVKGE